MEKYCEEIRKITYDKKFDEETCQIMSEIYSTMFANLIHNHINNKDSSEYLAATKQVIDAIEELCSDLSEKDKVYYYAGRIYGIWSLEKKAETIKEQR